MQYLLSPLQFLLNRKSAKCLFIAWLATVVPPTVLKPDCTAAHSAKKMLGDGPTDTADSRRTAKMVAGLRAAGRGLPQTEGLQ